MSMVALGARINYASVTKHFFKAEIPDSGQRSRVPSIKKLVNLNRKANISHDQSGPLKEHFDDCAGVELVQLHHSATKINFVVHHQMIE
jgi:hypothetical protein